MFKVLKYGNIGWHINNESIYREFEDAEETESWGKEVYGEWAQNYKRVMRTAQNAIKGSLASSSIECYCGYMYRQINEYLRNEIDDKHNTYRELADIMALVLCSAPRIPCDLVVYRLVPDKFIEELVRNNKKTPQYPTQEKGFMSTSMLKSIVEEKEEPYAKYSNLLKIYVDKNSIGIYVNVIANRSEEELLLFSNGYLALTKYPYVDVDSGKTVFECKLINFYC